MEDQDSVDELSLCRQNIKYLNKIGSLLSSSCPPASKFYMFNAEKSVCSFPELLKNEEKNKLINCQHCGSILNSDNCRIRVQPRQKANQHIKKLLKIERTENWKLNYKQKQKLKKYHSSVNKIVYRCLSCNKATFHPGTKRKCVQAPPRTTSTPVCKIRKKKGSLNAGLFIVSPATIKEKNVSEESQISKEISSNMESTESPGNKNLISLDALRDETKSNNESSRNQITPTNIKRFPESDSKTKFSAKKKKTLLAKILDQEQNKKKKPSLSSFLVSL